METEEKERLSKGALESILASGILAKSPNLARILTYICEKYWQGNTDDLKEYNLAVEALGRPPGFDPSTDAIVRVEAYRLRQKLRKYFETEGANQPVAIVLHPGSYVPEFVIKAGKERQSTTESVESLAPQAEHQTDPKLIGAHHRGLANQTFDDGKLSKHVSLVKQTVSHWPTVAIILAILVPVGILAHLLVHPRHPTAQNSSSAVSNQALPVAETASQQGIRLIAGYPRKYYVDRSGNVWQGDEFYKGGTSGSSGTGFIYRTSDPTLFQTYRQGSFSYDIPLHPGLYELRLFFAETLYGSGTLMGGGETSRMFDVVVNGRTLLKNFDIIADAAGDFTADVRAFKDITPAPDGHLHIQFVRLTSVPMVDAIQVTPTPDGRLQPIRLVAQNNSYTDHKGLKWNPDTYCQGGQLVIHRASIVGTQDPGLFKGERFGNFSYAIPVGRGKYALTLYFSEQYFGPGNPGGGGVGSRIFNVVCNDRVLLRHFDIFKEAGGANHALVETFHDLTPNAQGKLDIDFNPVVNYASVDALQVVDESPPVTAR